MSRPVEKYYRVDVPRYPALSDMDELALFSDYARRRTAKKREAIVRQYLYWAAELACRYCGPLFHKADAISAANYGLMRAIDTFDATLGNRFVTHSFFGIRKQVLIAMRDSYVVNPDPGLSAARTKFERSEKTEEDEARLEADRREVFERSSAPSSGGMGNCFYGAEPDPGLIERDHRAELEKSSLLEELRTHLPELSKIQQEVIEYKYFNGGSSLSFVEIGVKLKCTPDHARWLHACALKQLKKALRTVTKEL